MEDIGKRLAAVMNSLEMTPARFAKEVGENRSKICQYTKGTYKPSTKTIYGILLKYNNLNARWFLTGEGEMWANYHNEGLFPIRNEDQNFLMQKELRRSLIANEKYTEMLEKENEALRNCIKENFVNENPRKDISQVLDVTKNKVV